MDPIFFAHEELEGCGMIDSEGFRANVAMVIINAEGRVFWGKRCRQGSWQFPQGGINEGETALAAMYRELHEEVGLYPQDVEVISATDRWFKYRLPGRVLGQKNINCIGQKQKWFLLKLRTSPDCIDLNATISPEFETFTWVSHWVAMREVVGFKRRVYAQALNFFAPVIARSHCRKRKPSRERT